MLAGALVLTALIVLVDVLYGGAAHLLSFVGQQSGRALQIEAPLATPFMWAAALGVPGAAVYYNREILTFEVSGAGRTPPPRLHTADGRRRDRRGAPGTVGRPPWSHRTEAAPLLALLLVAALVGANKVGSPQYIGWFAVPVVWGSSRSAQRPAVPARRRGGDPMALLTGRWSTRVLRPGAHVQPWILVVLTLRNALEVAVLVWSVVAIVRLGLGDVASGAGHTVVSPGRMDA